MCPGVRVREEQLFPVTISRWNCTHRPRWPLRDGSKGLSDDLFERVAGFFYQHPGTQSP